MSKHVKAIFENIIDFAFAFIEGFTGNLSPNHDFLIHNKMARFVESARDILIYAQMNAIDLSSKEVKPVHILFGMTRAKKSHAKTVLSDFDIIESKLLPFIKSKQIPDETVVNVDNAYLSEEVSLILERSVSLAREQGFSVIGTGHLLIALMEDESEIITEILKHFDIQSKDITKRAEYYLNDEATYEYKTIAKQTSEIHDAFLYEERKNQIKSRLRNFAFGIPNKQKDE